MTKEVYFSIKEAADILGVSPLTLRNWDKSGKFPAQRHPMNNYRLYRVEDVEELLKELDISKVAKKVPNITPSSPEKPQTRKLKIDIL